MLALDARTGTVKWESQIIDAKLGYDNSAGPLIVRGKVIDGINGCERFRDTNCFITAHDATSGKELWRTFRVSQAATRGAICR